MNDDTKSGFRGTVLGLLIGVVFMLSGLTSRVDDPWPYFWGLLALTSVIIFLRLALALYYAGVRTGRKTNKSKED